MRRILKFVENFADWMYSTSYYQNVVKVGNPQMYVYSFLAFIYNNLCVFLWNMISILFEIKPLKPIWLVIFLLIVMATLFYFYDVKKVKNKIKIVTGKYDSIVLSIIFFISAILSFGSYAYLCK
ncbi:hypothetical protein WFZ85_14370 [Flavobacterium sp. j3]|uniref:Uncharacterized protein n=1 Tax=Flavobacterium aureirubrum TaxID=3133147 RepID=A0ABU9N7Y1_9FLAO